MGLLLTVDEYIKYMKTRIEKLTKGEDLYYIKETETSESDSEAYGYEYSLEKFAVKDLNSLTINVDICEQGLFVSLPHDIYLSKKNAVKAEAEIFLSGESKSSSLFLSMEDIFIDNIDLLPDKLKKRLKNKYIEFYETTETSIKCKNAAFEKDTTNVENLLSALNSKKKELQNTK